MKRKLKKSSRGFSLVEILAALLILVMLIIVINSGVNASMKVYRDLTFTSESDLLASTIFTSMSDMLRFADHVPHTPEGTPHSEAAAGGPDAAGDGSDVHFTNINYGIFDGYIFLQNGKFMVYLGNQETKNGVKSSIDVTAGASKASTPPVGDDHYTFYLVNEGAYTSMHIQEDSFLMKYEDGIFSGSYIIEDRTGELTKKQTFAFRTLKAKRGS